MILLKILFEVFVLYQITQVISESTLTKPFRDYLNKHSRYTVVGFLHSLMNCFLCTSVWVGFTLSFFLFDLAAYLGYTHSWFWNGLFFSGITWFLYVWEQSKTN